MVINRIAVIGGGGWGTAIANLLAEKALEVRLWVREEEVLKTIRDTRENREFLPGIRLSEGLRPVGSMEEALREAELAVIAVPSHVYRAVLTQMKAFLPPKVVLLSVTKGIENDSLLLMSQVKEQVLGEGFSRRFACLGGPSFAREVALKHPTAVTVACGDRELGQALQGIFFTGYFRVYLSEDVTGVELAGAMKNVIAIGAGTLDGLGFGHNARAALITRGLAEMTRLGVAMGAQPFTFAGLAGIGDLVLTCTGDLSRNRNVGLQIARGEKIEDITARTSMVAEGVLTTRAAYMLGARLGVDLPITREVYRILYEGREARLAVRDLMTRDLKAERGHYKEES
jgi:glycerol-3-phosphate dehydrogenase (NAD(P)+)